MSSDKFEQFRLLVLADESLQKELITIMDKDEFIERVIELGSENGFHFERDIVEEVMRTNRRAWMGMGL